MLYQYCPFCGHKFASTNEEGLKNYPNSLNCMDCKKIFYNNPKPAVAGLLIIEEKILLVKRKYNPYKGYWDLPGGFVEYGENFEKALKREFKEELDLNIEALSIKNIFNLYYPVSADDRFSLAVIVYNINCAELNTIKPNDDVEAYSFFNIKQIPENIAFPEQKEFLYKLSRNII